jgi:hypothetical protein
MRRSIAGLVVAVAALSLSPAAFAGTAAIPNACWWTVPGEWNNETLTLTGAASPERAGAGAPITLSGVSARIVLPREVIDLGFSIGLLKAGDNDIPIRAWAALRGTNTLEGLQVRETTAIARTTIVADANGEIVSATPLDVQASFPDTQWTAAADAPTTFTQAEAGTLPVLPVGRNGASLTPKGSIYITATLGTTVLQLDCQPGARTADATGPVPAPAAPFASVAAPDGSAAPPLPTAKPEPKLTLLSTKLKVTGSRVALKLSCAGAPCSGKLSVKSASKITQGKRKRTVTITRTVRYSLAQGATQTLKLRLTATARTLLKKRKLAVRVTTAPAGGAPLAGKLTLARLRTTSD